MTNKVEVLFFGNTKDLQRSLRDLDRQFGDTEKQATTLADRAIKSGDRLTKTLTPALAAAGVAAIKMASDQEQAFGAIDAVLGEHADTVRAFGETADVSYGLSREQVSRLGAITAAQLKSFGFANEEAAATTVQLQKRGADLAAMFGGPVENAISAIGALLRGERDPIERYGVSLKQVDINAELARQGLSDLEGEERKLAEAQAALTLLMEQTADAADQYGREMDSTAGQTSSATATAKNLAAELGTQLLPIAADVLGTVNNVAAAFGDLPDPIKAGIVQAALFGAALGPVLSVGGRVAQTLPKIAQGLKAVHDTLTVGASAARGASTALGGVATSTMAVSSVLGPLGLVVAAGATAWALYRSEQKEVKERIDRVRESLDAETAALTENTRTALAAEIDSANLRAALDRLGLTIFDVTGALTGEADAAAKVQTALTSQEATARNAAGGHTAMSQAAMTVNAALATQREAIAAAVAEQRQHIEDTTGLTVAQQEAAAQQHALIDATKGVTTVTGTAADAADDHADALDGEGDAADDTAKEFSTLADRIRGATSAKLEAVNPTLQAMEADRRATEATVRYAEVLADGNATIAEKDAALDAAVRAQAELQVAEAEAMGTTEEATGKLADYARQAGASDEAIAGLVDRVGGLGGKLRDLRGTYQADIKAVDVSGGKVVGLGQIGFRHRGGVIDRGDPGRVPGLGLDERLTALQVGEEVLTDDDPRHRRNLGRAGRGGQLAPASRQMERMMQEQTDVLRGLHNGIRDLLMEQRSAHADRKASPPAVDWGRELAWKVGV